MGKKKRALFSPKFKALREGKFSNVTKEDNTKMKFISRAKRKALEEKLATLETFSDEAKAIRGQLGWGEPAPRRDRSAVGVVGRGGLRDRARDSVHRIADRTAAGSRPNGDVAVLPERLARLAGRRNDPGSVCGRGTQARAGVPVAGNEVAGGLVAAHGARSTARSRVG